MDLLRAEAVALSARRAEIEKVLEESSSFLKAAGVGLHDPLVDIEGFPRADIDVYAVRVHRNRIAEGKNDLKAVTNELHAKLAAIHAHSPPAAAPPSSAAAAAAAVAASQGEPKEGDGSRTSPAVANPAAPLPAHFAVVDGVALGSPAMAAGLVIGDKIVSVDGVKSMAEIPQVLKENRSSEWVLVRDNALKTISLTPQKWDGQGLLGCQITSSRLV
jgi:26S proteasome non-ATPase regulatory subunit 9